MSATWAAIAIVILLLPGVGFFIGYWAQERYSREIVRSTVVGEVGLALLVAIILHLIALQILWWVWGFDPMVYWAPLADYATTPAWLLYQQTTARLPATLIYIVATTILGFLAGLVIAWAVMFGWLRRLATHKWAYDLIKGKNRGVVTAYVMTSVVEDSKVLMYTGHLEDFYLDTNGCFTYLVLKNCERYYMNLRPDLPRTSDRTPLFRTSGLGTRRWEHLVIHGTNIANVLFDPLGDIGLDTQALDDALAEQAEILSNRP